MRVIGKLRTLATLPTRERSPLPIEYEARWAPGPVSAIWGKQKSLAYAGNQNLDHQAHFLVTLLTVLLWLPTILIHLPSKSFIVAHNSYINAHIVTSYEMSLKIDLILDVMFIFPNVNLAIMDSVTIIFMLVQTVIMANSQCNAFIGYISIMYN
jgi:hypothetical protein